MAYYREKRQEGKMILAIIGIILAFVWLGHETNWLRIRLLIGKDNKPILLQKAGPPVLQLQAPHYEFYPIEYRTTTAELRQALKELSKLELEVLAE